ncbi:MAG: insulinase family protein [Clostridiales bacterium]|jgi:predicted Zn-dependent peptidase|nr:insulinase family protein [Clostridiales bacterium]
MTESYEKITLDNGVRILIERIPYVRSACAGIWVGTGSRNEKSHECGAAHFIEHMVFKGTGKRTAAEIAELMDAIGGQTNAFTSKEQTCFYGRVLDTHLELLLDVLSDMFFNALFSEQDVVSERSVILEEIDMYEDTPEDLVSERLFAAIYKGNSLSRPVLGTPSTLRRMTGEFLKNYMHEHYLAGDVVIALTGSIPDNCLKYLKERFSDLRPGKGKKPRAPKYKPSFTVKQKPIEQNHLCLAFPGCSFLDENRYAFQLMSSILGGGMSSRLFQSLRERLGLCYSIFSFVAAYNDTGIVGISTAHSQEAEEKSIVAILNEIDKLCNHGVTQEELDRAREQIKANVIMGLESTSARMHRLGKSELCLGKVPSTEDIINSYNRITREDILSLARSVFKNSDLSLSAVGNVIDADKYREMTAR